MDYTSSVLESRLDWLTVTCTKGEKREAFFTLGRELVKLAASQQNERRDWKWKGYSGWHSQGVTCGRREDSDILQLSGVLADEWFDRVWLIADNCTRVDLAVTVKVEGECGDYIRQADLDARTYKAEKGQGPVCTLIASDGQPATFYLGQRVSDLYARLYDKGLESGHPSYAGCLRYEVEVKGSPADRTCVWLHSSGNRPDRIRSAVFEHYSRRGVKPVFRGVGGAVRLSNVRSPSDHTTRLAWLGASVRPVVEKLIAADLGKEALEALGFPRTMTERVRLRAAMELGSHIDWLQGWKDERESGS